MDGTPDGATLTALFASAAGTCVVSVSSVAVAPAVVSVMSGKTTSLDAQVTPSNAANTAVTWSSALTATATVSASGVVTGVVTGTGKSAVVAVTVKTADGAKTASSQVHVYTVQDVQARLNALQCPGADGKTLTVDGAFGANSLAAFNAFQAKNLMATTSYPTGAGLDAMFASSAILCTATIAVTGVTVTPVTVSVMSGKTTTLSATVAPANASTKTVTWSSAATGTATVSSTGVVTGVVTGTGKSAVVVITGKTSSGGKTASSQVHVYTVQDAQTRLNALKCVGADGKVLTVDGDFGANSLAAFNKFQTKNALTTSSYPNSANLTAMFDAAAISCVAPAAPVEVTGVTVSPASVSVMSGQTSTLTATVAPSNATVKTVTWSSAATGSATVSSTGVVTGVVKGAGKSASVAITAKTTDGAYISSAQVFVYTIEDIQVRLNALTCTGADGQALAIDGVFGQGSVVALQKFESANNQTGTALPGSANLNVMFASTAVACKATTTPATVPTPPPVSTTLTYSSSMNLANHAAGTSVSVTGTVKSTSGNITKVTATVVRNQYNSTWTSCSVTPNATSYNMAGCSSKLLFSKLVPGEYTYTVKATNSAGTAGWSQVFTVKAPSGLYTNQTAYSTAKAINFQKQVKTDLSTPVAGSLGVFLSVAYSQIGYKEGQYDSDEGKVWWGTSTDNGNWTKYGYEMASWNNGNQWCAMFAMWAANQAGILKTKVSAAEITAIVYDYNSKTNVVTIIQGNTGDQVKLSTYTLGVGNWAPRGFGRNS